MIVTAPAPMTTAPAAPSPSGYSFPVTQCAESILMQGESIAAFQAMVAKIESQLDDERHVRVLNAFLHLELDFSKTKAVMEATKLTENEVRAAKRTIKRIALQLQPA